MARTRILPAGGTARSGRSWLPLVLLALLLIGAVVRLVHLADNPRWDGDEGYNWSIATNLAAGHLQSFALRYTFVDHPPLFFLIGAAIFKLGASGMLPLRALSALCGVAAILGTFALGARIACTRMGLIAAAIYALWPQAIVQSRWAYTYNLVTPLLLFALWAALPRRADAGEGAPDAPGWGAAASAGLLAGLALATDQEAIAVVLTVALVLWWRGGVHALIPALGAAAAPPAAYILCMLATRRQAFLFDVQHTATRVSSGGPLQEIVTLLVRFIHLCQFDALIAFGLYGVLLLPRGLARRALLVQTTLLLAVVLQVRDPNPIFHAAIPVLPLCAIGLSAIAEWALRRVRPSAARLHGRFGRALVALVVLVAVVCGYDVARASSGYTTSIDFYLLRSTRDAHALAAWVNARTRPTDLVIAMPQTAWLFHCRTADLLQAVAITGHGTAFYPAGLGPARFAFDAHLTAARFLVVDEFTRRWWIPDHPRERALVALARAHWRVAYRLGEYTVYANPAPTRNA